jgi:hypothetical protein
MEIVRDFNIIVDKEKVLKAVSSYYDVSGNNLLDNIFSDLEQLALKVIKPLGAFKIEEMPKDTPSSLVEKCKYIVYCIFTIGDEVSELNDKLFLNNEFDRAIILDAISTSILFNLSKQLYNRIFEYTSKRNLGLTCRIAPGDGEIDIDYQRQIVLQFQDFEDFNFEIVNDYLVKPYKSLTYIFGADRAIKINKHDHRCDDCYNHNCFMRDSKEKIRGPFDDGELAYEQLKDNTRVIDLL